MERFIKEENIMKEEQNLKPLCKLRPGDVAEVVRIIGGDNGRLMKLSALGLVPGSLIRLQQQIPAYVIWVGETQISLDREVAQDILLRTV